MPTKSIDARPVPLREPASARDLEISAPRTTLRDRILGWRDRLLASPRFQRWAASFPLTRFIALRRARHLFDLCAGFVYTQTLLACSRIRLFEALADQPLDLATLARQTSLPEDRLLRLLQAAESLGLVQRRSGGRFGLGAIGAPLARNPALAALIEHNALLYADLSDPLDLLRDGRGSALPHYWPYAAADRPAEVAPDRVRSYSALMSTSVSMIAADLLDAYAIGRHRHVLDVGGGEGGFLLDAGRRAPHLRLTLFDLPAVADAAGRRFQEAGLSDRARAFGGDFLEDPLPAGADLVTLLRVLHDHDDDAVLVLLRAVRRAADPSATILIAEPMSDLPGAPTVGSAYFGFYLLAMGSGRARSPREYTALLREAGFSRVQTLRPRTPVQTGILVARG
jgi:demethylspheroidene O-methyltransferase